MISDQALCQVAPGRSVPNLPVEMTFSGSSMTSILTDRLCGSIPITTRPITASPFDSKPTLLSTRRAALL